MKRKACYILPYLVFGVSFLLPATAFTQTQPSQSGVSINHVQINRERDSVRIAFDFNFDNLQLRSNRSLVLQPFFKGDGGDQWLPAIEVMGRRRYLYYLRNDLLSYAEKPYRVIKTGKDMQRQLPYAISLPYEPWMENASLYLGEDECGCGQVINMKQQPLAVADIAWHPALAYLAPKVETVKSRQLSGHAYLDFPVNKTEINPNYRRNPAELAKICATIDSVRSDNDVRIVLIHIKGYASPEGSYSSNARLAEGRTNALKQYLIDRYALADTLFNIAFEPEDWQGFRKYVETSNLPDKEEIIQLIDSNEDIDVKERQIRARYPQSYRTLLENCYPALRHSDYRIDYVIRGFNVDEAKQLIHTRPQNLSLNEMFAVAQTYQPGSDDFKHVFDVAVRLYPDSEVANLNAACALLEQGLTEQAKPYLDKSGNNPQAANARGVALLLQHRYDEALPLFEQALQGGVMEAKANLQILKKN